MNKEVLTKLNEFANCLKKTTEQFNDILKAVNESSQTNVNTVPVEVVKQDTSVSEIIEPQICNTQEKKVVEVRYCSIPDCGQKHHGKGYCRLHYRMFKNGTLNQTLTTKNEVTPNQEELPLPVKETLVNNDIKISDEFKINISNDLDKILDKEIAKDILDDIDKSHEDLIKVQKTKTILEMSESELTDVQKKDLDEHRAALKRMEDAKLNHHKPVWFNLNGDRII